MSLLPTAIAAGKLVLTAKKFYGAVTERWTTYRSRHFFESLLESLQIEQASGLLQSDVDQALSKLLQDEKSSEILFDAYRRVCFTKTKKYGPRLIGLLTAELINNAKDPGDDEEMIFAAAERLSDVDFAKFSEAYGTLLERSKEGEEVCYRGDEIIETISENTHGVGGHFAQQIDLSVSDLREIHGPWAAHLENCGLLTVKATQSTGKSMVSEDGRVTITVKLHIKPAVKRLYELLRRAKVNAA